MRSWITLSMSEPRGEFKSKGRWVTLWRHRASLLWFRRISASPHRTTNSSPPQPSICRTWMMSWCDLSLSSYFSTPFLLFSLPSPSPSLSLFLRLSVPLPRPLSHFLCLSLSSSPSLRFHFPHRKWDLSLHFLSRKERGVGKGVVDGEWERDRRMLSMRTFYLKITLLTNLLSLSLETPYVSTMCVKGWGNWSLLSFNLFSDWLSLLSFSFPHFLLCISFTHSLLQLPYHAHTHTTGEGDPSLTLVQLRAAVESLRVKQVNSLILDSSLFESSFYGGGQPFSGVTYIHSNIWKKFSFFGELSISFSSSLTLSLFVSLLLSLSSPSLSLPPSLSSSESWQWEDITSDYGAHPTPFIINGK